MNNSHEQTSTSGRAVAVMALVVFTGFVALVALALDISILDDLRAGRQAVLITGLLWVSVSVALIAARLVCGVAWCAWSLWIRTTLRPLAPQYDWPTPRSLVVWWFVPGLNLTRPYHATVELWNACESIRRAKHEHEPADQRHSLLRIWWSLWVAQQLAIVSGVLVSKILDLEGVERDCVIVASSVIRDLLLLAAVPVALKVVSTMNRGLERQPV